MNDAFISDLIAMLDKINPESAVHKVQSALEDCASHGCEPSDFFKSLDKRLRLVVKP